MASLSKETRRGKETGWRITWDGADGKRKTLRLGRIPKQQAERMLILVERLLEAKRLGLPLDSETTRWVAALDDTMAERLARLGLIPARKALSLEKFLQEWIDTMQCKPASKAVRLLAVKDLIGFLAPPSRFGK